MKRNIPRRRFERESVIELSRGVVTWPNGKLCRFNVRLVADQGSEGDVRLIAEDINREKTVSIKLRAAR